jgi:dTDP-4-dehydrorhamnose 3,5-epimerase
MIEGVKLIPLQTHLDERGFFREVLRVSDIEQFGQWSHSVMYTDTIKAFHIHQIQTDYWYVPVGVVKAVLADLRKEPNLIRQSFSGNISDWQVSSYFDCKEYILGDNQFPQILVIPPCVAHGLKVLQGPAHLFYITSHTYNPKDEGRIPYDSLGYDWFKQDIK